MEGREVGAGSWLALVALLHRLVEQVRVDPLQEGLELAALPGVVTELLRKRKTTRPSPR